MPRSGDQMPRLLARHQRRLPPHNLPAQGSSNPHPHRHKSLNPHPQILVRNPQILILIPTNPQILILKSWATSSNPHLQIIIILVSFSSPSIYDCAEMLTQSLSPCYPYPYLLVTPSRFPCCVSHICNFDICHET